MQLFKRIAAKFPDRWQVELKRLHFKRQISKKKFITEEPEFRLLDGLLKPGDWVVDVGANVGHYTKRFSELVGGGGRVIAFEPVPVTFSLLSANVQLFEHSNVSLFNVAVSDKVDVVGIFLPNFSTGLINYYQAHLSSSEDLACLVLTLSLDSLFTNQDIALVKIDVEGHEEFVLAGMKRLVEASRPILVIETDSERIISDLTSMGYVLEKLANSPNILFKPK